MKIQARLNPEKFTRKSKSGYELRWRDVEKYGEMRLGFPPAATSPVVFYADYKVCPIHGGQPAHGHSPWDFVFNVEIRTIEN